MCCDELSENCVYEKKMEKKENRIILVLFEIKKNNEFLINN